MWLNILKKYLNLVLSCEVLTNKDRDLSYFTCIINKNLTFIHFFTFSEGAKKSWELCNSNSKIWWISPLISVTRTREISLLWVFIFRVPLGKNWGIPMIIMGNFWLWGEVMFLLKRPCKKLIITLKRGAYSLKISCFNIMHTWTTCS